MEKPRKGLRESCTFFFGRQFKSSGITPHAHEAVSKLSFYTVHWEKCKSRSTYSKISCVHIALLQIFVPKFHEFCVVENRSAEILNQNINIVLRFIAL